MVNTLAKLLTGRDLNAYLAIGHHGHERQRITAATKTLRLHAPADIAVATSLRQRSPRDVDPRPLDRAFGYRTPQPPIGASHIAHSSESTLQRALQQTGRAGCH